jgi:6-phosphogluconate dehydrogenase
MQLGLVGLGRMGGNMVRRLMRGGHRCVVFDQDPERVRESVEEGAVGTASLEELVGRLDPRRVVWVMVPAGDPTEQVVRQLGELMKAGDILIDGGNSYYKDDVRRAKALQPKGIHYVDVGTSGGIWGLQRGYCLMIGGEPGVVEHLDPIIRTLAPETGGIPRTPGREEAGTAEEGYLHCGPHGAGHFVKMIHNGIEYGVMQAYGEGFDILSNAGSPTLALDLRYQLPLAEIAEVWRRGSVIASWLLNLVAIALAQDPTLSRYTGYVEDSGEGRWTILAALEEAVPADVLMTAVNVRFRSRQEHVFAEKMLSAMRYEFGGHLEQPVTAPASPPAGSGRDA